MQSLTYKILIFYAQLAIPLAIIGLPLYIYIPTFYHTQVGLSIFMVGLLLFTARISDVITDPLFGYLSDKSLAYFKSRKPMVALGAVILSISFFALLHPTQTFTELWLFSFAMLIYMGWSMVTIPYLSWSAEVTQYYHEKTKLNSARELFTIIGVIIALITPFIFNVSEDAKATLDILFLCFLTLFIPLCFLTLKYLRPHSTTSGYSLNLSIIKDIYNKLPEIKQLQLAYFINSLANALPATLFLYFVQLVLNRSDATGWLLILYFFSGIVALPFWFFLSRHLNSKKRTWIISITLACSVFIFVPFLKEGDLIWFVIISVISGFSLGADMALPSSIQSDIAQKAQNSALSCSGFLFGFWSMLTKLSLACALLISFSILAAVGFEQSAPTQNSLLTLSLLYGLLPVIFKLIVIYLLRNFKESTIN